jgi:hypothetical protein
MISQSRCPVFSDVCLCIFDQQLPRDFCSDQSALDSVPESLILLHDICCLPLVFDYPLFSPAMHHITLPLSALDAWSRFNDVTYLDCHTQKFEDARGMGLVTHKKLSSKDTFERPTLLIVPHDLILSAEAVEESAKVDQHLKELLAVAGGKVSSNPRGFEKEVLP